MIGVMALASELEPRTSTHWVYVLQDWCVPHVCCNVLLALHTACAMLAHLPHTQMQPDGARTVAPVLASERV